MTAQEKASELVNERFYQPLTIHLNVNNNSKQMWEYAKLCALVTVEELIASYGQFTGMYDQEFFTSEMRYWEQVKVEIEFL